MFLRLIQDGLHDGHWNMRVDEMIFLSHIQNQNPFPTLRFYRFREPVQTVGYGLWRSRHRLPLANDSLIRRLTGGGLVQHGADLTYSVVSPIRLQPWLRRPRESYHLIHLALRNALVTFGIAAELWRGKCPTGDGRICFDSPVHDDVILNGKKIAGAAQKRSRGYLLHQGSIAWPSLATGDHGFSEKLFRLEFARGLGSLFDLPVKEIPFVTEDTWESRVSLLQPSA